MKRWILKGVFTINEKMDIKGSGHNEWKDGIKGSVHNEWKDGY